MSVPDEEAANPVFKPDPARGRQVPSRPSRGRRVSRHALGERGWPSAGPSACGRGDLTVPSESAIAVCKPMLPRGQRIGQYPCP